MELAKFLNRVDVRGPDECWSWLGSAFETHGNRYGILGKDMSAHRISYELHCGGIGEGLVVDHKCRNGLCVNPNHLEAVTNAENILRGNGVCAQNARKTHCKRGHPLSGDNLRIWNRGKRVCVACDRLRKVKS